MSDSSEDYETNTHSGRAYRKAESETIPSPPQETGIDILENLQSSGVDIATGRVHSSGDKQLREAAQALLRLIEERVIGADEVVPSNPGLGSPENRLNEQERHRLSKNILRAEQRSKLRELLGNNDG